MLTSNVGFAIIDGTFPLAALMARAKAISSSLKWDLAVVNAAAWMAHVVSIADRRLDLIYNSPMSYVITMIADKLTRCAILLQNMEA